MIVHNSYLIASNDDECVIFCNVIWFFLTICFVDPFSSYEHQEFILLKFIPVVLKKHLTLKNNDQGSMLARKMKKKNSEYYDNSRK